MEPSLADLLNPAIGKGTAGVGAQTGMEPNPETSGLKPPPDNSFDRRADFSAAHRARKSTKGFDEAPQSDYVGKTPNEPVTINTKLAEALGYRMPGDEDVDANTAPSGVTATAQALEKLLREGRKEFNDQAQAGAIWIPHRPPRPEKSEGGKKLVIKSDFEPKGDQPLAIDELVEGVKRHDRMQVLLGVTGSGKTFTMAKVIERTQRPALVLAPNKTLAAQLYGEFKSFFPDNAVEYFVSYYDYYQPEAYVPRTDTYIEKESSINEQIDRMRHSATRALLERDDVIIVASVSCIYGIGSVETYSAMTFALKRGERINQRQLLADLVALQYKRTRGDFFRGSFRVRGDTVDVFPAHYEDRAWRINLFGDEVELIDEFDPLTGAEVRRAGIRQDLRQFALCDAAADADPGGRQHQAGIEVAARPAQRRRASAGSAAARAAHHLRHRDDGGDRELRRHRELFALPHRPEAGRAAADIVRVCARQRAGVLRREPRLDPAARRHVSRRLPAQGDARRIRLPPALLHGQPAAAVRGMGRDAAADRRGIGDAGRLGDRPVRRRIRRAGDPPDRTDRPAGRNTAGAHASRRPRRRSPRGGAAGLPRAGHGADQAHGRGPHRIPARAGHPRALHAFRHRHHRAHRDHPRSAARRLRRAGRHQPAARGPRHSGMRAGRDPRRRQGRFSAQRDLA